MLLTAAAGFWDPIWCLLDDAGRVRFETKEGLMPHINTTTDVAQMLLVALKLSGHYPQSLQDTVNDVCWAKNPEARHKANKAAARVMRSWVNNLAEDSPEWAAAPADLRQMLSDALDLDPSRRPPLDAILYHPCLAEARARVEARVEQHRPGMQQRYAAIHSFMTEQLEDDNHLETARSQLQARKDFQDREDTVAMQQHATQQQEYAQQQLDLAQEIKARQQQKAEKCKEATRRLRVQYDEQQEVQQQLDADRKQLDEHRNKMSGWIQRLQAKQGQQEQRQREQDERQALQDEREKQLGELHLLLQAQQQQQAEREKQLGELQGLLQAQQQQQQEQEAQALQWARTLQQAEQGQSALWQQQEQILQPSQQQEHVYTVDSVCQPQPQQHRQQQQQQRHDGPLKPVKALSYTPCPRVNSGPNTPPGGLAPQEHYQQLPTESTSPTASNSPAATVAGSALAVASSVASSAAMPAAAAAAAAAPAAAAAAAVPVAVPDVTAGYASTPSVTGSCGRVSEQLQVCSRLAMMLCSARQEFETRQNSLPVA
jgi:hypothetical protein